MEEMVSTGVLTANELIALIASSASFLEGAIFLAEQLPQRVVTQDQRKELLCCERFKSDAHFADYTSGRLFANTFELRWEKDGDMFRVVYVGSRRDMAHLTVKQDVMLEKKEFAKPYYLFGKRLGLEGLAKVGSAAIEGDFAELRIPRLLHYPVEKQERYAYVQLFIQEYVDQKTGDVALFRFQAIEPEE